MSLKNLGVSMLNFYKTIYHEMKISVSRIMDNNYTHQDKMTEAVGLVMLGTVSILPPLMIILGTSWLIF